MATVGELYDFLQWKAPFQLQMDFDNAGLLVGRREHPVERVLIALDITDEVIQEAIEVGVQLIVSHHPMIWGGAKTVTGEDVTGRRILTLAEHGVAAICAHTNLDLVADGVNDALAQALGLADIAHLRWMGKDGQGRDYGLGREGTVPDGPVSPAEFAARVKAALGSACVRFVDAGRPVHRVAVGGGACAELMGDALADGCDTLVTADLKYDHFLSARAQGLNLMDAGHFPTENVVCPVLQRWFSQAFPQVEVRLSQVHREVYACL